MALVNLNTLNTAVLTTAKARRRAKRQANLETMRARANVAAVQWALGNGTKKVVDARPMEGLLAQPVHVPLMDPPAQQERQNNYTEPFKQAFGVYKPIIDHVYGLDDSEIDEIKAASDSPFYPMSTSPTPLKKKGSSPITAAPGAGPVVDHADPKMRLSVFGNWYQNSVAGDWTKVDNVGWVHKDEAGSVSKIAAKCSLTGVMYLHKAMYRSVDPNGHTSYVNPDAAVKAKWFKDASTSYWHPPEDGFEVYRRSDTEKVKISKAWSERAAAGGNPIVIRCDHYKLPFMADYIRKVYSSEVYSHVSNYALEHSGLFQRCASCEHVYERAFVPRREETGDRRCERCYLKAIKGNIILAHNNKHYPKAICTKVYRMGHRVDETDGMVYATGKKTPVPIVRLFGLEAELEMHVAGVKRDKMNRISLAINVKEALGDDFVIVKEDGTLTMNGKYSDSEGNGSNYAGFEVVTAPADIAFHRERWPLLEKAKGYKHLRAWDTDTCGFHIHVTRAALNNLQIGRILLFINHPANQGFIHQVAGRGSDQFCKYHEKVFTDALHPERVISKEETDQRNRSRRVAVNLANQATIEFRIFRGTINPKHILRNLEFVDATCDYCYPASRSLKEYCTPDGFITFISQNRKRWPLLAEWMAHHKMIKCKVAGEKADHDKMTLKPHLVEEPDLKPEVAPRVEKEKAARKPGVMLRAVADGGDHLMPMVQYDMNANVITTRKV